MNNISFSEWLKMHEVGTSTASVANVPMKLGLGSMEKDKRKKDNADKNSVKSCGLAGCSSVKEPNKI